MTDLWAEHGIEAAVYSPYMPLMVTRGHAWTNKPKTKRLRKKVMKDPERYRRFAQLIVTQGMDPWPAKRERIIRPWERYVSNT